MKLYKMSWVTKSGDKVDNQLFTADVVSKTLIDLEQWGCSNIKLESVEKKDSNVNIESQEAY